MNNKEKQYAKISDQMSASLLLNCGLGLELAMINKPSLELPYLFIGVPCIIIGAAIIISWRTYYDHRISMLKWQTIILVFAFLVSTILFFKTSMNVHEQERVTFYLLNAIIIILLIIIFLIKRNNLRGCINK